MKNGVLILIVGLLLVAAGVVVMVSRSKSAPAKHTEAADSHELHNHANTSTKPEVPKFQTAEEAQNLPVTLPASQFIGKTRQAYEVAKKIPATLAQLPCYCHCDQAFGHKSLHSCFVDDHASHCAVCVDEALLAYKLQTEQKLTPEQVREKIIEKYSATVY